MITPNRWIDIVATQRPRNAAEPSPQYGQKFWTIALPEYNKARNIDMLPDMAVLHTNHPQTQILKNTQWSLAHIFMNNDTLDQRWLWDDFWSLYIWATTNASFYRHDREKQWVSFIRKYMQAIGQTALKSEMIRQKMIMGGANIQERWDDFGLIWCNELQERFIRKLSDESIYTQYHQMAQTVACLEELSYKLVVAITKQWKDIDFWPQWLEEKKSMVHRNGICLN